MSRRLGPVLIASFVVGSSVGLVAPLGVAHAASAEIRDNGVDDDELIRQIPRFLALADVLDISLPAGCEPTI